MLRIGYLIGQFPGPTHTFFWREIRALRAMGLSADLVSTRPPTTEPAPHAWAAEAISQTEYLAPITVRSVLGTLGVLLLAGPLGWLRCLWSVLRADDVGLIERLKLPAFVLMGARLAWSAKRRGWQHVHVGFCRDAANIALFSRLLGGPPYSLVLHAPLNEYGGNQRRKWERAAFGLAVSRHLLAELRETLAGHLPTELRIASMGVDLHAFRRNSPYVPWDRVGPIRIFCCARLTPDKGQQDLLPAVAMLRKRGYDVRVRLAGEDLIPGKWFTGELNRLVRELELGQVVEFLGPISEECVRDEIEAAHVVVLASRREGLGIAAVEAMAMGAPVIVGRAGGLKEVVEDGVDGLTVEPASPAALADAIATLLENPIRAAALGRQGRRKAEWRFGCERGARVLMECLGVEPTTAPGVRGTEISGWPAAEL